jgi:hypothetical protein
VTPVRQKDGNHCFVACAASAALDAGIHLSQEEIVEKFPVELQKDSSQKSGVPKDWSDVERVLTGLQLAKSVERKFMTAGDAKSFLLNNKTLASRIFIETGQGTHCVRLCEVRDDGPTIMEPMDGKFWPWDWSIFEHEHRALVILRGD